MTQEFQFVIIQTSPGTARWYVKTFEGGEPLRDASGLVSGADSALDMVSALMAEWLEFSRPVLTFGEGLTPMQ